MDWRNLEIGGRCEKHLSGKPCQQCAAEHVPQAEPLDIDDVRDRLREMSRPTTDSALSKQLGISPQYLCDVLLGRREPGPKLLKALGLRKEIRYVSEPRVSKQTPNGTGQII